MSLVDRVNARAQRPVSRSADPVSLEEFGYLLSGQQGTRSRSGVAVGPQRALGIAAWYSGVRYLAETVSSLPWFMYRRSPDGTRNRRPPAAWMAQPEPDVPWPAWVEFQMMCLLHRGDGFSFKIRNAAGQVTGLRSLHPDRVRVGRDPSTSRKRFKVDEYPTLFTSEQILHIPGLSYDGLRGIDVIRYQGDTLGIAAAADEYAARFFDAGSHLDKYIALKEDITRENAVAKKETFQAFHRGLVNAHELAILGGGAELKSIDLDPQQTQLLETRKYGVTEVARILRIPPHKLYDLDRSTNNNIEHQSIEAVTDGIRPWVERIETYINFDPWLSGPSFYVEAQMEGLLRGDQASRFAAYSQAIQFGFMNRNEPRRLENLPEEDGLDAFLVPVNMREVGAPVTEPAAVPVEEAVS